MGRARSRRRRGKTGGVGSSRSKSKSNKSKSKSTGGSRGRSSNTRGGQSKANRNQNKKAKRTVKSVKKAAASVAKGIGKSLKGAAANAASAVANSSLASKYNRKTRDMSKLTPQSRRRYERLSQKTGRDYSKRDPTMRINLSADRLAQFAGVADKGWYKGLTSRFPGIRKLQINKQLYSNPMKKGWHSSQRTGRGQGLRSAIDRSPHLRGIVAGGIPGRRPAPHLRGTPMPENRSPHGDPDRYTTGIGAIRPISGNPHLRGRPPRGGPERDWLSELYSTHNINQGKLDQGARDYWSKAAETQGRDAVMQSIIGTSKAQGTYGGRKKPMPINTGPRSRRRRGKPAPRVGHWGIGIPGHAGDMLRGHVDRKRRKRKTNLQNKGAERRMAKSVAAHIAARGI